MNKNIIKIVLVVVIVGFLSVIVHSSYNLKKQHTITTPIRTLKEIEASDLDDRQNRIDHVLATKGKYYQRYSLTKNEPKKLIITYYKFDFKNIDKNKRNRRGILVFEEKTQGDIKLIWESTDNVSATWSIIGTYDLTGDGIKEIIVLWEYDKGEDFYIYKWNGSGFDMITPYVDSNNKYAPAGSKYLGFGGEYGMTKIFDVDKDGIPEIVQPHTTFLGLAKDLLTSLTKETYQAYKWNGEKYYLWKEQEQSFTPSTNIDEYSVINILDQLELENH
jgi:hypothetical protein